MGYKKEIWVTFILAAALGLFFQLGRTGTLWHISPWTIAGLPRESYLVIYDPNELQSVLKRNMVEKILREQKKEVGGVEVSKIERFYDSYQGVIITTNRLKDIECMPAIERYVEQGGNVMVLSQLRGETLPAGMMKKLGAASIGEETTVYGIRVRGNLYLGLQGFGFSSDQYGSTAARAALLPETDVEVTAWDGTPLVWSHASGRGRYWVCNTRERNDKNGYGMYTAMIGRLQEDYVYPVMNMKLFFLDGFPSPALAGDFYRKSWWPEMRRQAERYNWKYTGMIVESGNSQVSGSFFPPEQKGAGAFFLDCGRELLKSGGELGVHGYNRQPLAPAGYGQEKPGFPAWADQADMEKSLQELKRYVEAAYPDYEIHSYSPPSNILSPEGKKAVKNVFPRLKAYAAQYNESPAGERYVQDFYVNPDATCEIPRVSFGHSPALAEIWASYSGITYNGVFSHAVRPDEVSNSGRADLAWPALRDGMRNLLADADRRFNWLEPATASKAADIVTNYFRMNYRVERDVNGLKLYCWNFNRPLSFILRTGREIRSVQGGRARRIQQDAYLLTVEEPEFALAWTGEQR